MSYMSEYALLGCLVLLNLAWIYLYLMGTYSILVIPHFQRALRAVLPELSVVIAACNEETTIEQALRTLLAQDYPDLEIIIVDDRSADEIGAILDRLATGDKRLKIIHNEHLPAGWLGKVNALKIGMRRATGKWVLFTDADVHFTEGLFHKMISYTEQLVRPDGRL